MANVLTFEEVAGHKCKNNCWILIHGKVYDVSSFMEEHPGGEDVLLSSTGKDATDDFEDVGHSDSAKELMQKYYIGDIDKNTVPATKKYAPPTKSAPRTAQQAKEESGIADFLKYVVPILILGVAFVLRFYGKKESQ